MFNKRIGKKYEQTEVPELGTAEGSQDDSYTIPVLRAAPFPMSPELMRREKEERLRKNYDLKNRA